MVEAQQTIDFYQAGYLFLDKLTKTDLKVYHAVGELGHDTACKAYQHEIAAQANLNPRQVRRSLARLVAVGLLERSGGRYGAVYRFVYPKRGDKIAPSRVAGGDGYTKREDNSVLSYPVEGDGYTKREDKIVPSGAVKGNGYTKREDNSVLSDRSTTITTTTKETSKPKNQLVVIQDDHAQNLGALDIAAQENLSLFKIRPNLTQKFHYAPQLIKEYTPAQILMFHDHEGKIAANLARWRQASDTGQIDLAGLAPALIWCKIVELQEPPLKPPSPESQAISQEIEAILAGSSTPPNPLSQDRRESQTKEQREVYLARSPNPLSQDGRGGQGVRVEPGNGAGTQDVWSEVVDSITTSRPGMEAFLADSYLADGTGQTYTVVVKDETIAARLNYQWRNNVARTLAALTGQHYSQVEVNFIAAAPPRRPSLCPPRVTGAIQR
jgi:hypothetical protein